MAVMRKPARLPALEAVGVEAAGILRPRTRHVTEIAPDDQLAGAVSRLLFRRRRRRAASAAPLRAGCRRLSASGILPGERRPHEGDECHDNE